MLRKPLSAHVKYHVTSLLKFACSDVFQVLKNYFITFSKTFQNLAVSICGTRNLFKHEWHKFSYNFSLYIIASFMKIDIPSLFLNASPYWYIPAHFLPSWVQISPIYAIIQKPFPINCQIISNFLKGFSAKSVIILAKCVWRSTLWGRLWTDEKFFKI